jgi:hypothetical protein
VDRYGHDAFTPGELMVHFNDMVNFANAQHGNHDDDVVAGGALAGARQP